MTEYKKRTIYAKFNVPRYQIINKDAKYVVDKLTKQISKFIIANGYLNHKLSAVADEVEFTLVFDVYRVSDKDRPIKFLMKDKK